LCQWGIKVEERRKANRGRTYLAGRVTYDKPCSADDCLVRNLSRDGAKITFSGAMLIPDEFDLAIPNKDDIRRARIVWRQGLEAGIMLLSSGAHSVAARETARRIRMLEADRDTLARRVAQLSEIVQ
jgi:hypothetical protein